MSTDELRVVLPHRTANAIRIKRGLLFPDGTYVSKFYVATKVDRLRIGRIPWSEEEIQILKSPQIAAVILPHLHQSRSAWSVSHRRRKMKLPSPGKGRPVLLPTNFAGVDWSMSVNRIAKATGVCWVTAQKLKQSALGAAP